MRADIHEKLRSEVESGVSRESQVVYILANIRKILELNGNPEEFTHLKFYCNWALHSKLSGSEAQHVLRMLEPIYSYLLKRKEVPDNSDSVKLANMGLFQEKLSTFLQKFAIKDFTRGMNDWVLFMYLYSKVIEDCPLVISSDNPINIKNVVVRAVRAKGQIDDHQPYRINWTFAGKDDLPSAQFFIINSYSVAPKSL